MSTIRVDTLTGSDGTSPVTLTKQSAAKAWVNFNGTGTIAITQSEGVSSISDNGTGDYSISYTNAFSNSEYIVTGSKSYATADNGNSWWIKVRNLTDMTTSAVRIKSGFTSYNDSDVQDSEYTAIVNHGDLA